MLAALLAACGSAAGAPSASTAPSSATAGPSAVPSSAPGVAVVAASPVTLPLIDTSTWAEQTMPNLGFLLKLPPGWERVGPDPQAPVPSIAQINTADPTTAGDLQTQAQAMSAGLGLFDALGMWSVDPGSLLQLGLLAGSPYRVSADQLEGLVQQSVANRASQMSDPTITPISLPAGEGYLAVYLDVNDLSEHREVHLRTPAGRYLIMATTYPGLAEPDLADAVLAVASTIRPMPGDLTGDVPAPSVGPQGDADPALTAQLPATIAGIDMTRSSINGEELVGNGIAAGGTVAGEFGRLVSNPGDVSVALAVPTGGESPILVAGYRLRGVDTATIDTFLTSFPSQIWGPATVGGKQVLASLTDTDGTRSYLRVAPASGSGPAPSGAAGGPGRRPGRGALPGPDDRPRAGRGGPAPAAVGGSLGPPSAISVFDSGLTK